MGDRMESSKRSRKIRTVLLMVLLVNLCISIAKIVVGTATGTGSVQADGIHSIFDGIGNAVGLVGIAIASRPADENHPYGHGKYEAIASLVIGLMLLVAAWQVGGKAIGALMDGTALNTQPSTVSLVLMVVTLCLNVLTTTMERVQAKRLSSEVLAADAKHTFSDVMVTLSVIVGLVFVHLGFPIADPIATLVVTVAIVATAVSVFRDVQRTFSDVARIDPELIVRCAMEVPEVIQCHKVRTRGLESEVYVDLHVLVDPQMSVSEGHAVGDAVEQKVLAGFEQAREVMVHIEPATPEELAEADA